MLTGLPPCLPKYANHTDYLDDFIAIGNANGGAMIQAAGDVGTSMININAADGAVCYLTAQVAYTPSKVVT